MKKDEIYKNLQSGGAWELPYLIELEQPGFRVLRYVNNNEDVTWEGNRYIASSFKYSPPKQKGGALTNGSLEITALTDVLDLVDVLDTLFRVSVVGVIQDDEIQPIKIYHHQYGTVTYGSDMKVTINFTNDDRLNMVFPPYVFDTDNNRGNT